MQIVFANNEHIDLVAPLFDAYRVFYKQESDLEGSRKFIQDRISNKESTILLALDDNQKPLGFTQLFPIFSSVTAQRMYILNDLYVNQTIRSKGVGTALLNAAKEFCKKQGYKGLVLQTETHNPAQELYKHLGWEADPDLHFFWKNPEI
ncbi:GNAT family N-acetyltransferase [Spongiivirga citrea]|uniref:GNAT family N-acetyltransferase n=1 Tax=Spongiivirga citrea TaxID=1481457 RepID=A0A6M0CEF2_9FLAO|nr:GNAT family N-acetyltransferase [Spongiivirga citrea]NER15792.1 GNAT family N-acetyltransferase [Spongiivirga citrea]